MGRRSNLIASVAASTVAMAIGLPVADAAPKGEHCVVHVVGQRPSGEYELGTPSCHPTFRQAVGSLGIDAGSPAEVAASPRAAALLASIGVHYDGLNKTGASITVSGVDCLGGYVNLTVPWRNRISSTLNGCPRIRHFDGLDLTGGQQSTVQPGGNLTTLDNRADSIQYTT